MGMLATLVLGILVSIVAALASYYGARLIGGFILGLRRPPGSGPTPTGSKPGSKFNLPPSH